MLGYVGGFIGPLVVGWMLDLEAECRRELGQLLSSQSLDSW
jgi:hypothetical protein